MQNGVNEKRALVTGATDGLGRGVAVRIAGDDGPMHIHGRSSAKLVNTAEEIGAETGNEPVHTHLADLSSLEQVRRLSDEVTDEADHLDVLVNNAGIGSGKPASRTREESADGHELRFAVNYLAGFLLTLRLLPLLQRAESARIVNVASLGQAPIDFADPMIENGYEGKRAYSQSKLAQIAFGFELAERLGSDSSVTVNSLHPSTLMPTKMVLEEYGESVDSLEQGIEATARLACSPELEGVTGRFYDCQREAEAHPQAYDVEARRRLWELSEELTGASL